MRDVIAAVVVSGGRLIARWKFHRADGDWIRIPEYQIVYSSHRSGYPVAARTGRYATPMEAARAFAKVRR